jgi:capsule polysaccharide modification protein KpsS
VSEPAPARDDDAGHVARFEACAIPLTEWNHRAHLRVAYHYLRHHPFEEALARMRRGIQAYNATQKIENRLDHGYHETLTQMWMRILHGLRQTSGPEAGFDAFVERHPYLLVKLLGRLFYTRERIMTEQAKRTYVPPDLATFPGER